MNAFVDGVWWLLVDASLKSTVLLAATWVVLAVWRPRNSSVEHRVWTMALAAMLAMPLLVQWAPGVLLPWGVYPQVAWSVAEEPTRTTETLPPTGAAPDDAALTVTERQRDDAAESPHTVGSETGRIAAAAQTAPTPSSEQVTALSLAESAPAVPKFKFILMLAYLAGVVWFGARLFVGLARTRRIVARARLIELPTAGAYPVNGARLLECDEVTVPVTVGVFRSAVLLPLDWTAWSEPLLQSVLAHEGEHVRRRDVSVAAPATLNGACYWFHPGAWWLRRRLANLAEQVCDDAVIAVTGNRTGYARSLLEIAGRLSGAGRRTQLVGVAMARTSQVERRIEAIVDSERPLAKRLGAVGALLIVCVALPLAIVAAGLRAAGESQAAEPDSPATATAEKVEAKTPALQGRITDETGSPVTDATLELTGMKEVGKQGIQYLHTKTDENGQYHFDGLEASDDFRLQITSVRWVGLTKWKELPQLRLSSETTMERDFVLKPACRIVIRTLDEAGQPIAGVQILGATMDADRHAGGYAQVTTDKLGWATVGGLPPSDTDYLFATMHDDFAFAKLQLKLDDPKLPASHVLVLTKGVEVPGVAICADGKPAFGWTVNAMPNWWRFGTTPSGQTIAEDGTFTMPHVVPDKYDVTIGVPTGDGMTRVEPVLSDVPLPGDGRLELKLRLASPQSMGAIAGTIKFAGGEPSGSVMVDARGDNGNFHSAMIRPGARNFRIMPLPPGQYTMRFTATDVEEKTIENVTAPADGLEVELTIVKEPRLVGRVVTDGGAPLKGLRVRAVKTATLRGPNYVQDPQWREVDDEEGRFEIEVVGPGVYQVLATADELATSRSADINTDKYKGEPLTLELGVGSSLSGRVVDEAGQPIDGAKVAPMSQTLAARAQGVRDVPRDDKSVVTVAGTFTLPHLTPGTEWLKISHPDYCGVMLRNVTVAEGDTNVEPITLTRGGRVLGRVYDADGQPAPGVALKFDNEFTNQIDGENLVTAVTDRAGEFEVDHLPAELCYVFRDDEWNQTGVVRQAILPVNGETHRLNFGGENAVVGQLVVNGEPLAGTKILLGGESPHFGIFKANAQTDGDGRFIFWGPAVGRRTLYYLAPGSRRDWVKAQEVAITPETTDLGAISLHTATVTVEVRGLTEATSAGARVRLLNYSPIWANSSEAGVVAPRTGADAPWVIEHVPSGRYEVKSIRKDGIALRREIEIGADDREVSATLEWPVGRAKLHGTLDQTALGGPGVFNPPNLWSKDRRLSAGLFPRDGAYSLSDMPAGEYFLTDKDVRYAKPVIELTLADREDKTLDLTADNWTPRPLGMGMISVLCYTEEGVPISAPNIVVAGKAGELKQHSSQNGRTTFVGEPGSYSLTISFPGFEEDRGEAAIEPLGPDGRPTGKVEYLFRLKAERIPK